MASGKAHPSWVDVWVWTIFRGSLSARMMLWVYSDFIHIGAVMNQAMHEMSMMFFIGSLSILLSKNNAGGRIVPNSDSTPMGRAMDFIFLVR